MVAAPAERAGLTISLLQVLLDEVEDVFLVETENATAATTVIVHPNDVVPAMTLLVPR